MIKVETLASTLVIPYYSQNNCYQIGATITFQCNIPPAPVHLWPCPSAPAVAVAPIVPVLVAPAAAVAPVVPLLVPVGAVAAPAPAPAAAAVASCR
jgi:hypothetical protein